MDTVGSKIEDVRTPVWEKKFFLPMILVLIGICAFGRVIFFPYSSYDDDLFIRDNPLLLEGAWQNFIQLWKIGGVPREQLYLPVTYSSYFLDARLWSLHPGVLHAVNLLLHLLNTLLLFTLAKRIGLSRIAAGISALIFLLHPLQVEAVVWCMGRKDLLATAFALGALLCFSLFREGNRISWLLPVYPLVLLAMLSKPVMIILPLLFLLLDWFFLKLQQQREWKIHVPLWLMTAAVLWLNLQLPARMAGRQPLLNSLLGLPYLVSGWARRLLFCNGFQHFYRWPVFAQAGLQIGLGIIILLGVALLLRYLLRNIDRNTVPVFGLLFAGIAFIPALGYLRMTKEFITADRYGYFPLLGVFLVLGWLYDRFADHRKQLLALGGIWLIAAVFQGQGLINSWWDELSFWQVDLLYQESNPVVHYHLAAAYQEIGNLPAAESHYHRCLKLDKDYYQAYINLGVVYFSTGHYSEAVNCFRNALRYPSPMQAQILANLADALVGARQIDEAVRELEKALQLQPDFHHARLQLATLYLAKGRDILAKTHAWQVQEQGIKLPAKLRKLLDEKPE